MDSVELIKVAAWPAVALILGVAYLFSRKIVGVKLPGGTEIHMSNEQAGNRLSELFEEFLKVYNSRLSDEHKRLFRQILAVNGAPTVEKMIPGFSRDSKKDMTALRALRGLGLIEPLTGKTWQPDSQIIVTKFGKSLTSHIQDKL